MTNKFEGKATLRNPGICGQIRLTLMGILTCSLLVSGFILLLNVPAQAGLTSFTGSNSCVTNGCHATLSTTTPTITTAVNGVSGSAVTVASGGNFQLDWMFSLLGNKSSTGTMILVPTGWGVAAGSATSPGLTGWKAQWDQADGIGWSQNCNATGDAAGALGTTCYSTNFVNSGWDAGSRDTARDDGGAGDLDGTPNSMGTDATVNIPTSVAAGSYTVKAYGAGHDGNSRTYRVQNISVTVIPAVISTSPNFMAQGTGPTTVTINGAGFTATGLSVAFSGSGITTGTPTYVSATQITVPVTVASGATIGAGDVSVTCSGQIGTGIGVFSVTPSNLNQSISNFPATATKTYGDSDYSPGATASSGLTVTYASSNSAVATIVSNQVHIVGAGSTVITASQAGDAAYNPAPDLQQTLTVNKSSQTITFGALPAKIYGDADFAPGGSANSGLTVSYASSNISVATIVGGQIHIVGAGTTDITASQSGNTNFNAAADVVQALSVNAKALTITANPQSKVYGSTDPALTYTATGFVNGDTSAIMTGSLSRAAGENVGSYAISQETVAATSNYTISYTGASLGITAAPLTVTAEDKSRIYGSTDPALTYTATGFVNGDTSAMMTGSLSRAAGENVGSYAISQGTVAATSNYSISYTGASLGITAAPLTVTAEDKSKAYGTANPVLTVSYSGFVNGDTADSLTTQPTAITTAVSGSPVGTYPITASGGNSSNYTFTYVDGILTIASSSQTITFNALPAKTYGDADFAPGATASSGLTVTYASTNPSVATIISGQIHVVGSGITTIIASQAGDTNYGAATDVNQPFVVNTAALTVTADDLSKTEGSANPPLTVTYNGFVNGDTAASLTSQPTPATAATESSPAGTYPITVSGGVSNNYSFSYVSGTLTVTVASNPTLTVTTAGAGIGSVNGTGITCPGDCSEVFTSGTPVTLMATPDWKSLFAGWSGACTGSGNCDLTMNANQDVTATFDLKPLVMMPGPTYYATIQDAYNAAIDGTILQGRDQTFTEDLVFDRAVSVTFNGGNDVNWTVTGNSTINGTVTIAAGGITISNLIIQ